MECCVRPAGRASGPESALGFLDAPASDPHGEGSSAGEGSLGKAGEQGKPAWSFRTQCSVPDQHAPASPFLQIEVGLEAGWGWKRLRWEIYSIQPSSLLGRAPLRLSVFACHLGLEVLISWAESTEPLACRRLKGSFPSLSRPQQSSCCNPTRFRSDTLWLLPHHIPP